MPYSLSGIWELPKGYETCTYAVEGEQVIAPFKNTGQGIKCTVQKAAGNHAFVVNEKREFRKWFEVRDLVRTIPNS